MSGVMGVMFTFRRAFYDWRWDYEVHLTTDGTETVARVELVLVGLSFRCTALTASATSKRSPHDIHVPIIGFALALGRALEKLGDDDEETLSTAFRALARTCAELGV